LSITIYRGLFPRRDGLRLDVVPDVLAVSITGAMDGLILALVAWGLTALASVTGAGRAARRRT
jgi:hypothetical protein